MKCLLLALGLALVCGAQAAAVPQTMENLDLPKVGGRPGGEPQGGRGGGASGGRTSTGGTRDGPRPPPGSPSPGRLVPRSPRAQKVLGKSSDV